MKVLSVIRSMDPADGGPVEGITQRAVKMKEMGVTTEVLCADSPQSPWLKELPFTVHALGPAEGSYGKCPAMVEWLHRHRSEYDIVTAHGIWQYSVKATQMGLENGAVPFVVFIHGMLDPYFDSFPMKRLKKMAYWPVGVHPALRDAEFTLFTTEEERRLAHEAFKPWAAKERVIAYGTNGHVGDMDAQRELFLQHHPELRGKRILLFLSRIHSKKGCDILIQAFAHVFGRQDDWRLVIAGPDQTGWTKDLKALATQLHIADKIVWPGMLQGDLKWGAFAAAEAFVLPSHQENFGIVVAEALSCGKPVLISDKVNIWREVKKGEAGLVAQDNLDGTILMFNHWEAMPQFDKETMSRAARICYETHFSIEAGCQDFLKMANEAIARKQAKSK